MTFENFTLVGPAFYADDAVGGVRFGKAIVDVGAQRMQRKLTLQIPFRPGDFGAVEAARHPDLDSLAAEAERRVHTLAHGAAEGDALLQLEGDRLCHQLSVQFGLMHFLNVDEDFALGAFGQVALQLLDFGAFAADDDARARREDRDAELLTRTVHLNGADAGGLEPLGEAGLQIEVFLEKLGVVMLGIPARTPRLGHAKAEAVGMYFLTHPVPFPLLLVSHGEGDMSAAPLITIGTAHRRRTDALHARTLVHVRL